MPDHPRVPLLTVDDLLALGQSAQGGPPCDDCNALVCAGWESLPGGFDRALLRCVGTLKNSENEEPTVAEYHPAGTHGWSADAPIAPAWFPYNRCDVWACAACGRPFLRYTEYGGYYTDERIRALNPDLVATGDR
ncbi:hypothetical protein EEB15_06450 [Ramlibacter sp. WS9]|nr:hypothetical protein EEB15_06450 [Ramlibacter sp. WS9]